MFDAIFWKEIKTNYEKSYYEFENYIHNNYKDIYHVYIDFFFIIDNGKPVIIPFEILYGIIEIYFDGLKIEINIIHYNCLTWYFVIDDYINKQYISNKDYNFNSRLEAKLAAVKKSFELRETQLKEVKHE